MRYPRFLKPGWLVGIPLMAVLVLAVACGDDATPVVIEKEVIVEKEVIKEVRVEVPVEVVKEVIKEVTVIEVKEVVKEVPVEVVKEVVVVKEVPVEVVKEVVVEKEVQVVTVREVEVVKEVPVEVVKEVVVEKEVEVVKEVQVQVLVTPTPVPSRFAVVADAVYGGIVPMSSHLDLRGWDPHKYGGNQDIQANGLAYNQLVEYDPLSVSSIICDLCTSWDVSDDNLHYTFHIEQGVQWQDGRDLTADDIVYSLNRLITEGFGRAGLWRPYTADVNPVEKVDTYTVRVNLKQTSGAFFRFMAGDHNKMLPIHTAGSGVDIDLHENSMGSGPWIPTGWNQGIGYSWERNPNYFKEGRPFFDGIEGFIFTDPGLEIAAYQTHRVLMPIGPQHKFGTEDALRLSEDADFMATHDLFWLKGTTALHMMMNAQISPFDQPEVRRAMFLAMDRWEIMEGLGQGQWDIGAAMSPLNSYALPREELIQLPGYRRNPDGSKPQEDIDEAIRLLNSVGYTDDNPLKFEIVAPICPNCVEPAEIAKVQYVRFGLPVDITLVTQNIGAAIGMARNASYQMMSLGCGPVIFDPDDMFYLCYMPTGRNWSRHTVPGVEELFFKQQVEPDPIKRREINWEMQRLVYAGSPGLIEHSNRPRYAFVNKRIRTENGVWQQRLSAYTQLKHEHEWLLP